MIYNYEWLFSGHVLRAGLKDEKQQARKNHFSKMTKNLFGVFSLISVVNILQNGKLTGNFCCPFSRFFQDFDHNFPGSKVKLWKFGIIRLLLSSSIDWYKDIMIHQELTKLWPRQNPWPKFGFRAITWTNLNKSLRFLYHSIEKLKGYRMIPKHHIFSIKTR